MRQKISQYFDAQTLINNGYLCVNNPLESKFEKIKEIVKVLLGIYILPWFSQSIIISVELFVS